MCDDGVVGEGFDGGVECLFGCVVCVDDEMSGGFVFVFDGLYYGCY